MSSYDQVVGRTAVVTHPVSPDKPGEVVVHIRGGTETYMAYSDEALPEQATVLIVAQRSARTVEVTAFIS